MAAMRILYKMQIFEYKPIKSLWKEKVQVLLIVHANYDKFEVHSDVYDSYCYYKTLCVCEIKVVSEMGN